MEPEVAVLDEAQRQVAFVDPGERQLVTAGPGAGKTEVVAALVDHLIDDGDVLPTDELLVISFSRAAVGAVRRRLESGDGDARLVTVRTMDSLAAMAVEDLADQERPWRGHDDLIRRATDLLGKELWEYVEGLRHLVVDEVQDVVGVRAEFLMALLRALPDDAGFTLLGDPAQALYDFQLEHPDEHDVFTRVRSLGSVATRDLTGEYRSRSTDAAGAAALRKPFLTARDDDARLRIVENFRNTLAHVGALDEEATLLGRWEGRTAILCRTNIEALLTADLLRRAGVPVSVQRSAQERSYAPWIALALGGCAVSRVTRSQFGDLLKTVTGSSPDPDEAWQSLRRTVRSRGAEVDLRELARALAAGRGSAELETPTATNVVVSTVHRAKGLQFDNVVLMAPDRRGRDEAPGEAARTLFVALTRSRDRMAVAAGPDTAAWTVPDRRTGRWVRRGRHRWQTFGFEVRGSDTRALGPTPDSFLDVVGCPVAWRLNRHDSDLDRPVYEVVLDGRTIARTTEDFGLALAGRLGSAHKRDTPWPALAGGHVESLETMAGAPSTGVSVGRHGLWPSVRVTGAIDLDWKGDAG